MSDLNIGRLLAAIFGSEAPLLQVSSRGSLYNSL